MRVIFCGINLLVVDLVALLIFIFDHIDSQNKVMRSLMADYCLSMVILLSSSLGLWYGSPFFFVCLTSITHTCLTMAFDSVRVILSKSQDNMMLRAHPRKDSQSLCPILLRGSKVLFPVFLMVSLMLFSVCPLLSQLIGLVRMVVFCFGLIG